MSKTPLLPQTPAYLGTAGVAALDGMISELYCPPPAAALGYTTLTLGPNVTLGSNWFLYNLKGVTPIAGQAVQQADGSVYMSGADGSGYGANICTAFKGTGVWGGLAFGGGFYVEFDVAFTAAYNPPGGTLPFPALWSLDINNLAQIGGNSTQWVGQAAGYIHYIECDFMQWAHNALQYNGYCNIIDWYGANPGPYTALSQPSNALAYSQIPVGQRCKMGFAVVPATATSQGYINNFLNGRPINYAVGSPIVWNLHNPSMSSPPVVGTTAASLIDQSQLALIIGTDSTCPMTVYGVSVWQGAGVSNTTSQAPSLTAVVPNSIAHGTTDYTMFVNGTNFTRLATVYWGATALTTTYLSSTLLRCVVTTALVASAGTATVTVQNVSFLVTSGLTVTIT